MPSGGWLDGCLNGLAGVKMLRRINAPCEGRPPVTVRRVDRANEEGVRLGKRPFDSSASSGSLAREEAGGL